MGILLFRGLAKVFLLWFSWLSCKQSPSVFSGVAETEYCKIKPKTVPRTSALVLDRSQSTQQQP